MRKTSPFNAPFDDALPNKPRRCSSETMELLKKGSKTVRWSQPIEEREPPQPEPDVVPWSTILPPQGPYSETLAAEKQGKVEDFDSVDLLRIYSPAKAEPEHAQEKGGDKPRLRFVRHSDREVYVHRKPTLPTRWGRPAVEENQKTTGGEPAPTAPASTPGDEAQDRLCSAREDKEGGWTASRRGSLSTATLESRKAAQQQETRQRKSRGREDPTEKHQQRPSAASLLDLELAPCESLIMSGEDVRDFYHQFMVTRDRAAQYRLVGFFRPKDVQHLQAFSPSLLGSPSLAAGLSTTALGDVNALSVGQAAHVGLILDAGVVEFHQLAACGEGFLVAPSLLVSSFKSPRCVSATARCS